MFREENCTSGFGLCVNVEREKEIRRHAIVLILFSVFLFRVASGLRDEVIMSCMQMRNTFGEMYKNNGNDICNKLGEDE